MVLVVVAVVLVVTPVTPVATRCCAAAAAVCAAAWPLKLLILQQALQQTHADTTGMLST